MKRFLGVRRVAALSVCVMATGGAWLGFAGVAGATTLTAPTINGPTATPQEGQTLTVTSGTAGPAGDTFDAPTYQWLVCHPACPALGPTNPTGSSLPLTSAEVGATIVVAETVNDSTVGAALPNPVTTNSAATPAVLPLPPANPAPAPSILGTAQQGQTLTASPGVWTPAATSYTYSWTSGGFPVGTNSQTYLVAPTDVGKTIAVSIVASNAGGNSASVAAGPTTVVLPLPPANLAPPTISGAPLQGQVLTMTPGTWSNNPTLTNVWEDCSGLTCNAIPGQTGPTYTVAAGDVGHTIEVVQTASNAAPPPTNVLAVPSARTSVVSATSTTTEVAYSQNSPTTNQAVTLVAAVTSSSGNANPRGSLSFFNGSNTVSGCANKGVSGGQTVTIVCQASFGAGQAQISAAYVADPTSLVAGSTSDTTSVDVGKGPTSISLAVTPKVAPRGRATYVATLGVPLSNAGPVLPSGSIEFLDGGQPIGACVSQPLNSLTATCSMRYASAGVHSITAQYDGDSNFTGSTSPESGVQIVKGAPKAPAVRGALGATMGWTIYYRRHYSWVSALTAFAVPKGTTILVLCAGKGCPFAERRLSHVAGTVHLQGLFHHRHLRSGARITVRLMRQHWIGKSYSFTIRAGRKPTIKTVCLAPGNTLHIVGCPATS